MKQALSCPQFSPQKAENHILRLWNLKFSCRSTPPDPLPSPRKRGLTVPCWYSRLLYSNLLATSLFIETPVLCIDSIVVIKASTQYTMKCEVPVIVRFTLYKNPLMPESRLIFKAIFFFPQLKPSNSSFLKIHLCLEWQFFITSIWMTNTLTVNFQKK